MASISKPTGPQRTLMLIAAFFALWFVLALMGAGALHAMRYFD